MAMDQPSGPPQRSPLTKSFVILCSMAMVGGYMFYRSGGAILPSTKSARVSPMRIEDESSSTAAVGAPAPDTAPRYMPGSKSAPVLDRRDLAPATKPQ